MSEPKMAELAAFLDGFRVSASRWGCACGWAGEQAALLRAASPFDATDDLVACPQCKQLDGLFEHCQVPGCQREATCGTPTPDGYRRLCAIHYPEETTRLRVRSR